MEGKVSDTWCVDNAERLKALPPYLFAEIDRAKRQLEQAGVDVIDLGVGDPDLPTPAPVVKKLQETAEDPANHRYSFTEGLATLRRAIADWYQRRFNVTLDPDTEVLPLLGSKEGIAHLPLALVNPGEYVLVPDPCYPPYRSGTMLAGAQAASMPLTAENQFLPDFGGISQRVARQAALMFLNYPNNPTAAVATEACFQEAIQLAKDYQIIVAHDAAYSELAYDGCRPISFLQLPEAKEVGVEFHSVSKTYNMTGWRVGWVCGNARVIAALAQLKTHLDSGIFQPLQWAAIEALQGDQSGLQEALAIYQRRRDLLVEALNAAGWQVDKPKASIYVWAPVPGGESSMAFATRVLEQAHVVITPGRGFGEAGEGFVRMSLTVPTARLEAAAARLVKAL
ncbi:MAG: LL-diaminopimelate aminotransferase [Candidatus Omnitrophica bacterium]|nr:LL-diaminopimelate aminotransferase [Candidatus Omnitrophota bacterium]